MHNHETVAKALGYAGLIPFVVLSIGAWLPLPLIPYPVDYLIAYAAVILAFMVISYVGWKVKKNSNREISARGYSKVTKFYRDYYSMRRDIRAALKDDKITYKELKDLKAKYREAAKKRMK